MKRYFNWWSFLVMGLVAMAYGIFAVLASDALLKVIGLYIGLMITLIGLVYVIIALYNRKKQMPYSSLLTEGCVVLLAGIFITIYSQHVLSFFVFLIGLWLLIVNVFMLFAIIKNTEVVNKNLFLYSSVIGIIIGVVFIINPTSSIQFITRLSGVFSIIFGVLVVIFSLNLRKVTKELTTFDEVEVIEN